MKKFLKLLIRPDNFNRLIIFISMCLFIVYPSLALYGMNESSTMIYFIPSIVAIGVVIGNGLLSLYQPMRTSWFYFFICGVCFAVLFFGFNFMTDNDGIQSSWIFYAYFIYSLLGFLFNVFFLLYFLNHKGKFDYNEKTNNDNVYDFLGGEKRNDVVSNKLENMISSNMNDALQKIKKEKFSKVTRILSFLITLVIFIIYFFISIRKITLSNNPLALFIIFSILSIIISFVSSIRYPIDFKYIFYFNSLFDSVIIIIMCSNYDMKPVFIIVETIFTGLTFISTLIVEGRTWMGANPD